MRKKTVAGWIIPFVFALLPVVVSGMGGLAGDAGPTRIPTPDVNYDVTVIDTADVHTRLSLFSVGGYAYFFGQHGKGRVAVPLEKIRKADVSYKPDGLQIAITLKDGNEISLAADKNQRIYGKTSYGNYEIALKDIKTVIVNSPRASSDARQ